MATRGLIGGRINGVLDKTSFTQRRFQKSPFSSR